MLNGQPVSAIHADLTAGHKTVLIDVTTALRLPENTGVSFQGPVLVGPFEVDTNVARDWLKQPNPNGRPNSDVIKPLTNGKDITSRTRGLYVVDFAAMSEADASLYELPFEHVQKVVKPLRDSNRDESRRSRWWLHGRLGTDWRKAISSLPRYIATSRVAKHRAFVWFPSISWPSDAVVGIARADDTTFGILHSRASVGNRAKNHGRALHCLAEACGATRWTPLWQELQKRRLARGVFVRALSRSTLLYWLRKFKPKHRISAQGIPNKPLLIKNYLTVVKVSNFYYAYFDRLRWFPDCYGKTL